MNQPVDELKRLQKQLERLKAERVKRLQAFESRLEKIKADWDQSQSHRGVKAQSYQDVKAERDNYERLMDSILAKCKAEIEGITAQVQADEAAKRAAAQAGIEARRVAAEQAWIQAGGTPEAFKAAWPGMLQEYLAGQVKRTLDEKPAMDIAAKQAATGVSL